MILNFKRDLHIRLTFITYGIFYSTHFEFRETNRINNDIPQEKDDGPLYKFYEIIMDSGGQFMEIINNLTDVTILAPSNAAWMDSTVYNVIG